MCWNEVPHDGLVTKRRSIVQVGGWGAWAAVTIPLSVPTVLGSGLRYPVSCWNDGNVLTLFLTSESPQQAHYCPTFFHVMAWQSTST